MVSSQNSSPSIGIVGGGFVGITLAGHLLNHSNTSVNIFERDTLKVKSFKSGNYLVVEPELNSILDSARLEGRLLFNDESAGILDCLFISIGTPKGMSSNRQLNSFQEVISSIEPRIVDQGLIFLRSTVSLGTTQKLADWISSTHRRDLSVYFAPERTTEGNAIQELRTLPQIIGGTARAENKGIQMLQTLGFNTISCSSSKVAELAKLACNTWRDTIFAYANELAAIADFEGIDVYEVIESANLDYPRGGIPKPGPVGGPCLSKDSHILLENKPYSANSMILAGRFINEALIQKVSRYLISTAGDIDPYMVEILGAAFKGKPFTNDIRDGLAAHLISDVQRQKKRNILFWITDKTLDSSDLLMLQEFWHVDHPPISPRVVVIGHNGKWVTSPEIVEYLQSLASDVTIIDLWGVMREFSGIKAVTKSLGSGYFL